MMLTWTPFPHTQYRKRGRIRNDPHHHGAIDCIIYATRIQAYMQPIHKSRNHEIHDCFVGHLSSKCHEFPSHVADLFYV
jgi:hypothetical protein